MTAQPSAFSIPAAGVKDSNRSERDGMIGDALWLAASEADHDPSVIASRERMNVLVQRLQAATEAGHLTGADADLWFDIDSEKGTLMISTAYAVARAWLLERGSVPLDRQTLMDYFDRQRS